MASTIPELLTELRSGHYASSPRLTWYGPGGERIELSGRVLDNWVAKTANFLTEELEAERGTRVRVDLPVHWKTAVVTLAAWQVGAVVLPPEAPGQADITFMGPGATGATVPDAVPEGTAAVAEGTVRVAVALGALELAFPAPLPAGTYDYAALVRQFADSFEPFDPPGPDDEALITGGGSFSQQDLIGGFATPAAEGERVLAASTGGFLGTLARLVGVWAAGGSAVLLHESVADTPSLREAERISTAKRKESAQRSEASGVRPAK